MEASTGNTGTNGSSNNTFSYVDTAGNTFNRKVDAFLNKITLDQQSGNLAPSPLPASTVALAQPTQFGMNARLPGGRIRGA